MADPTAQPPPRTFTDLDWLDSSIFHATRQQGAHPGDCIETIIVALKAISAHLHATPDDLARGWTVADLLGACRGQLLLTRNMLHHDGHPNHYHYDSQVAPIIARIDTALLDRPLDDDALTA